jgi:hypothetical protein
VAAAAEARRTGLPEPFVRGIPELRKALPLLGMTAKDFRSHLRLNVLRLVLSRYYLGFPLPTPLKSALRSGSIRLGLRPLYLLALRSVLILSRNRS